MGDSVGVLGDGARWPPGGSRGTLCGSLNFIASHFAVAAVARWPALTTPTAWPCDTGGCPAAPAAVGAFCGVPRALDDPVDIALVRPDAPALLSRWLALPLRADSARPRRLAASCSARNDRASSTINARSCFSVRSCVSKLNSKDAGSTCNHASSHAAKQGTFAVL